MSRYSHDYSPEASLPNVQGTQPSDFRDAIAELRAVVPRREIELSESPAPQRLAPHAVALSAEVFVNNVDVASGRLVLLHDPEGPQAWDGLWRVVVFAKATLEPEMTADPMLSDVGWTWLQESLADESADLTAFGGTVTRTHSAAYGAIADREPQGQLEIRASWTPLDSGAGVHARAWLALLATMAGLTPIPDGVTSIAR